MQWSSHAGLSSFNQLREVMQHTRRERHHVDRNASAVLGIMEPFLSMPRSRGQDFSEMASYSWDLLEQMEDLCLRLEPRDVYATERLVEVPFVLQKLPRSGRLLDIGCVSSSLALQLACLGYHVTGVDVQDYPLSHPNLDFRRGNVLDVCLQPASYDCAILLSVIEHVGLGHYGDPVGLSDRTFLETVACYVRAGGSLLVTVPFGLSFECDWYRVYDAKHLEQLLASYIIVDKRFARRISALAWEACREEELASVASGSLPMNGVAMLELRK